MPGAGFMFCQRVSVSHKRSAPNGRAGQEILSRRKCVPKKVGGMGSERCAAGGMANATFTVGANSTTRKIAVSRNNFRYEIGVLRAVAVSMIRYAEHAISSAHP